MLTEKSAAAHLGAGVFFVVPGLLVVDLLMLEVVVGSTEVFIDVGVISVGDAVGDDAVGVVVVVGEVVGMIEIGFVVVGGEVVVGIVVVGCGVVVVVVVNVVVLEELVAGVGETLVVLGSGPETSKNLTFCIFSYVCSCNAA